jgi:nitroreductase
LPQPLHVVDVMALRTLADVRVLVERRLPKAYRDRPHWRAVARDLAVAAAGGDPDDVAVTLMMAFAVEGIACRPRTKPSRRNR